MKGFRVVYRFRVWPYGNPKPEQKNSKILFSLNLKPSCISEASVPTPSRAMRLGTPHPELHQARSKRFER